MRTNRPCTVMYDLNVLEPLADPIMRNTMCRARRTVRFREYFIEMHGTCGMEKAITDLSFCAAHALDFAVAQRTLVEKYNYQDGIQRPFCEKVREIKERDNETRPSRHL